MGLLGMAARTAVVAGTATAVSGRVAHRQDEKWAEQSAQQQAGATAAGTKDALTVRLQQLAQLHSEGVLSDEEFTAAKAKALGL